MNKSNFKLGAAILLIGYLPMLLTSFSDNTTQNVLVVKPALPKSTAVLYNSSQIVSWIKMGYQVQSQSQGSSGRELIIMVKY
jgi:hypothetical protein